MAWGGTERPQVRVGTIHSAPTPTNIHRRVQKLQSSHPAHDMTTQIQPLSSNLHHTIEFFIRLPDRFPSVCTAIYQTAWPKGQEGLR